MNILKTYNYKFDKYNFNMNIITFEKNMKYVKKIIKIVENYLNNNNIIEGNMLFPSEFSVSEDIFIIYKGNISDRDDCNIFNILINDKEWNNV